MEVKLGYKQTEVGVIPQDWQVRTLRESCSQITDGTHDTPTPVRSGVPFLTAIHIKENFIDFDNCLFLTTQDHQEIFARCNPHQGDVLMVNIGAGVATTAEVNVDYEFSLKNVALLKPVSSRMSGAYLNQCLIRLKPAITQALSSGGAQPFLSLTQIGQITIPVPEKNEQVAIAKALSEVDALLGALDRLIVKKRDLKQAAMQQLLTGATRLPGFHGEWKVVRMREVLKQNATYGIVTAGTFVRNGVRMLRSGDIVDGRINTDLPMVSLEKAAEYSRTTLEKNDVVIALVGYPGASARIPDELIDSNISRAVGLLRPNEKVCADFLVCFLNSPEGRRMVLAPSAGSAQQVVNLAALNKLQFSIPGIPEQNAIGEVLMDMDAELAVLEQRQEKARALKQGMMQELLTGKTRLV